LGPHVWPSLRRFAVIVMMTAAVAFSLEGTLLATPQAGPDKNHHHGHTHGHSSDHAKSHVVTHVHVDGIVHRHAVDEENGGLARHMKERGSVTVTPGVAVLPSPGALALALVAGIKLAIEPSDAFLGTEPDGPRKPPRPPSIA
jgi:ABC-type nickel/cobalt efflux system permease component RcnA